MAQNVLKRVILDVDPGIDDAFAILAFIFAAKLGRAKIEAITLTHGNGPLPDVTKNVIRILELVGQTDIPIYAGANEPLIRSLPPFIPNHFGKDGFCDIPHEKEPNLNLIQKKVGAVAIYDIVKEHPGEITLVCLGPLTNVALTIKLFNDFVDNVKEIFIMGGNYEAVGNTETTAEFNFYMDPEAAHIVLQNAKSPLTILAYETGINSGIDLNWRFKELGNIKSPIMDLLNKVEQKIFSTTAAHQKQWNPFDFYLAVAILYPNEIITHYQAYHVAVEISGVLTRGQMVLDHRHTKTANADIIKKINIEALKKIALQIATTLQ